MLLVVGVFRLTVLYFVFVLYLVVMAARKVLFLVAHIVL